MVLLGLGNGKLSLFDGSDLYDFPVNDNGYLAANSLSEGLAIGDSLYAFSTLGGGALVVDRKTRNVRSVINTLNDLPDDEIFAMEYDHSGGLWLSHQAGLTRAFLNFPVENYSVFPGLQGNLTSSLWYRNVLYAATSEGVFYLMRDESISEFDVLVQDTSFTLDAPVIEKPLLPVVNTPTRKTVFSRIFGGKEEPVQPPAQARTVPRDTAAPVSRTVSTYSWKRVRKLESVEYRFKKIEGLDEKVRQLAATENGLLVAATRGLYRIRGGKAEAIVKDRYINFISEQGSDGKYYIGTNDGFFAVRPSGGSFVTEKPGLQFTAPIYSIARESSGAVWLGGGNKCYRYDPSSAGNQGSMTPYSAGNDYPQIYWVGAAYDTVRLYLETGIYRFDRGRNDFVSDDGEETGRRDEIRFNTSLMGQSWLRRDDSYICLRTDMRPTARELSILKIFDNIISIDISGDYIWVIDGRNRLYRLDRNRELNASPDNEILVTSIYTDNRSFSLSDVIINSNDKSISFEVIAPGFIKRNTTYYQYIIDGRMPDWSKWSLQTEYTLPFLDDPGHYTLRVRAKDIWDNVGEPVTISFSITAPFTQTSLFYVLVTVAVILVIVVFFIFREMMLKKEKKVLETKVRERTAEIESQKNQITSSILYASRIQVAMLPADDHFRNVFDEFFIFFRPRDIVSGDFYWIGEDEKNIYVTVADCTGHGVPGAFMSTLGITTLNEIISNTADLHANTVLNMLRDKIKTALHQTGKEGEATDGMDMAFCILSKDRKKLQYAGAYNPLFIFQGGEFREFKGDRMPIGIHYGEKDRFTNWDIDVSPGNTVYVFSDGLADQFGGVHGSKFKITNLKKLLKDIYFLPLEEQRKIVQSEFEKWKGSHDQVDDVTMIGFRI
jgi:serine phosphatase RsbU (regulator of sigma subunit)